jgi:hypothetical protein
MSEQRPAIQAHFVLDKDKPSEEAPGHYAIRLSIKGAPADTYAVTYGLHSSYYDPIREAINPAADFSEKITSYGNFEVTAKLRTKSGPSRLRRSLYDALQESHGEDKNEDVQRALRSIRAN